VAQLYVDMVSIS